MEYTFLLPAYKSRFLKESLNSIQNQTFREFSVIISDDCSPENLAEICKPFLEDERFSYRRNGANIGAEHLAEHWNLLLGMAESEYVIMASDDDVYDEDFLQEIDDLVTKYPNANVIRPKVRSIDERGNVISTERFESEDCVSVENFAKLWASFQVFSGVPYYVFKRDELIKIGGFANFPFALFSDDATVFELTKNTAMAIPGKALFSFRMSASSISHSNSYELSRGMMMAASLFWSKITDGKYLFSAQTTKAIKNHIQNVCARTLISSRRRMKLLVQLLINKDMELFSLHWRLAASLHVVKSLIANDEWYGKKTTTR